MTGFISYRVSTSISSGSNRSISSAWIEVDTGSGFAEIDGTRVFMYNRSAGSGENTGTANFVYLINAGDVFRIRVERISGSDTITTVADGSEFVIYDLNGGEVGPTGPSSVATLGSTGTGENLVSDGIGPDFVIKSVTGATGIIVNNIGDTVEITTTNIEFNTIDTIQTTNNNTTTISTIGTTSNKLYYVDARVQTMESDSSTAGVFLLKCAYRNTGGTLTQLGSDDIVSFSDSTDYNVGSTGAGTNINVDVKGATGTTLNWENIYIVRQYEF